ncbi:MAG: asparagine synthase (glutamine-hydrolyzing) [Bacillota bacterium]|nr:asparagine synthase (glutamine-hydrolyzing) [Bacillota bacterium]
MCGICGIVNKNGQEVSRAILGLMSDTVSHRGPNDAGSYFDASIALGHRRLSIIDLSNDGHQPMHYMGRYTIVFNGEIFNYIELKEELTQAGYSFLSKTDTEIIMAAYDYWGKDCVNYFNGMWAFALYDKKENILFCSRDRFGIKPFYYANLEEIFLFGSEIKQLLVHDKVIRKVNLKRAIDFLLYSITDHTEETLFEGIFQLRGGYNLIYDLDKYSFYIYQWYNLKENIKHIDSSFEEASSRFEILFKDSVKLRLRSDVKIGSCLSGGLDSSSIVTVINDIFKQMSLLSNQETVSACFENKEYDEQYYIDEVIRKTGVSSHKVFPDFKYLNKTIDKMIWYQDEPFGSTSIFSQWCVFEEAKRNNLIVMLDGQGSDEQLAGYHPFFGLFLAGLLRKGRLLQFLKEKESIKKLHGYKETYILRLLGNSFLPRELRKNLSIFLKRKKIEWLNVEYDKKEINDFGVYKDIRSLSIEEIINISVPMLLHYEDRNSMAHSIEARVPFLDHRLVEFNLGLPDNFKIHNAQTKYILRESLKDILPEKIKNRYDKMGFVTPEFIWIKENKDIIRRELSKACSDLQPIVNTEIVLAWFDGILEGKYEFDHTLWRLICLGRWVNLFRVKT